MPSLTAKTLPKIWEKEGKYQEKKKKKENEGKIKKKRKMLDRKAKCGKALSLNSS